MLVLIKVSASSLVYKAQQRDPLPRVVEHVESPSTRAWKEALIRAGIEGFRWHDLRHTWASWLAQQGTPMNVLQELGGWESEEMVKRYAHLSKPQLMQHSELVSNVLDGTISAHQGKRKGRKLR